MTSGRRIAIVLFNLGGPDRPEAVEPFLCNLFSDPSIIGAPGPVRWVLAKFISRRRAPVARHVYDQIGGGSPILPNTVAQATALSEELARAPQGDVFRVFIGMRYWHPFVAEAVRAVADWGPDEIVLLPLYPQFSTTTTASSLRAWDEASRGIGLKTRRRAVCCYPTEPGFIAALSEITAGAIATARAAAPGREPAVIFSAHGLPQKIVAAGDPYVAQVEATVGAVVRGLGLPTGSWEIAYQSRVGPLKWVGPSTDAVIAREAAAGRPVVVVPVAFVSEHSETLVELDIEYRHLAERSGAPAFVRAPTVATHGAFIAGLARMVAGTLAEPAPIRAACGQDACRGHSQCALAKSGR